jgi:CHAT domain-containing protein
MKAETLPPPRWKATASGPDSRTLALLIALLLACACARGGERELQQTFDEARQAVRRGEFEPAQKLAERGIALAPADSAWAWTFRLYRGEVLVHRRHLDEVTPLLTAPLPEGAAFDPLRARRKYLAALVHVSQNAMPKALTALGEARALAPEGSDVRLEIELLEGQVKLRLAQWAAAEQTLNTAVARAAQRGDRFSQAQGWNYLGMGRLVRGRWDEAAVRFEHVLSFSDLEQMTVYAGALTNAGLCYARLGAFDRAIALQRRAEAFYSGRGRRGDYANALGELGNTHVQQGRAAEALPLYQKALTVARDANLPDRAALWAGNLAAANIALGHWDEAERSNEEAKRLKTLDGTPTLVHNTLNAAQIAQGRGRMDDAAHLFNEALRDQGVDLEVRWAAHAGLAEIAIAQSRPRDATPHFEAALDSIEKTRADLIKTDYKVTFLTRLIRFYQSYVDALIDRGDIARALEVADSSRGRVLAARNNAPAPSKAAAAALRQVAARSKSVLLSYWLAKDRSYLWVVSAGGIHGVALPPAAEIAALVTKYKETVDSALADPLASAGGPGDRLYEMLVEPAAAWLPRGTRVMVVADGALHGLNFETLPVPGDRRRYWIEDVEIQIAPGLSLLAADRGGTSGPRSLLLIGDAVSATDEFPPLKYASAEIANVSKYFPSSAAVYTGPRASPGAYKDAAPGKFSFVHFTAHAAANLMSPLDSAVILSGPENAFKLYARDVADVPLHAELVTVSACRSAGERAYSGEGLIGFAWAFLRAGANRVIAGLWDVDDRSTADLMDRLYAGIHAGQTPAQALRAAKLSLLAQGGNYRKPYYWGPFQVFTVVP